MKKEENVAIEKNYLSTFGWEVDDAYYKIRKDYTKQDILDDSNKNYVFTFEVFRNKNARDSDLAPLMKNTFIIEIDESTFDNAKSKENNYLSCAYGYLKNLTNSFKTEGMDV